MDTTPGPSGPPARLEGGSFAASAGALYRSARVWVNVSGAVSLTILSAISGWRSGFVIAAIAALLSLDAIIRVQRSGEGPLFRLFLIDATAMGIGMTAIGLPTVAGTLAIILVMVSALVFSRRQSLFAAAFVGGWLLFSLIASRGGHPSPFTAAPLAWDASIIIFGVAVTFFLLRLARAHIDALEGARARLIGEVTHDLKSPLATITGLAQLLAAMQHDTEAEELIELIADQVEDAIRLTDDLLASARLDVEALDVTPGVVSAGGIVADVLLTFGTPEGRTITFSPPSSSVLLWADAPRVRQVLRNLLSNAHRYGGPTIEVRVAEATDVATIEVADDGAGIPPDRAEVLFEPFAANRTHAGSSGLGLSVSRRIARVMGGDLTHRRERGHTIFSLTLPRATAAPHIPDEAVTTASAHLWLREDGIVQFEYREPGIADTTAPENAEIVRQLLAGVPRPLLVVTKGAKADLSAIRTYATGVLPHLSAAAVVTHGSDRLATLADLVATMAPTENPIRAFPGVAEAEEWLSGFLPAATKTQVD